MVVHKRHDNPIIHWPIIGVACLYLTTKRRSHIFFAVSRWTPLINLSCPQKYIRTAHLNSRTQKVQLCTIFLGLTDRHSLSILCISQNETVFQIYLRSPSTFPWIYHKASLMVFFASKLKFFSTCAQRSNIDHFSRSHGSSFTRRFVYYSGRNCVLYMFASSHDASLDLS